MNVREVGEFGDGATMLQIGDDFRTTQVAKPNFSLVIFTDNDHKTWPSGFKYSNASAHRLARHIRPGDRVNGLRANCVVNVYLKNKTNAS